MTADLQTVQPLLPLWAEITVAVLVLSGALIALLGSFGLLRLRSFFERIHAPAIIATLGCWCVMYGALLYFSFRGQGLAVHLLLIAVFIAVTVPITTIFLMRASLFRARQMGKKVPPSLSGPANSQQHTNR
jgi:multicomponent K+:H+ antiporter subunit G